MNKYMAVVAVMFCVSRVVADQDVAVEWHVHSSKHLGGFSDGTMAPLQILLTSWCQVVVFSDHLDGVIEKGIDKYLEAIRKISGTFRTIAIPAVEVTCGKGYKAYDVIVLGLTSESLSEIASLFTRGAFIDPENGLPALKGVADRYGLVLIAAHPDAKDIPFYLGDNSQYVHGFEMFSDLIGYSAKRFTENCADAYKHSDRVTIVARSDFHAAVHGSITTRPFLEAPMTRVLIDDDAEIDEQSITESIKQGRVYASSLIRGRIVQASTAPGKTWHTSKGNLYIVCDNVESDDLLYQRINVFCTDGVRWESRGFGPVYKDGKLTLSVSYASLMDGTKALNVDFGGRIFTSTILVKAPQVVESKPDQAVSVPKPEQQIEIETKLPTKQELVPYKGVVSSWKDVDLSAFKYRFRSEQYYNEPGEYPWVVVLNEDFSGFAWVTFMPNTPSVMIPFPTPPKDKILYNALKCFEKVDLDVTFRAKIETFHVLWGGPEFEWKNVRFFPAGGYWGRELGDGRFYLEIRPDYLDFVEVGLEGMGKKIEGANYKSDPAMNFEPFRITHRAKRF